MKCIGINTKGQPCKNTITSGRYCIWHGHKVPKTKTLAQQASTIHYKVCTDQRNESKAYPLVDEVTVALYNRLFTS
jgi:adenosylmethionine-8-amino-7-oxononanoate aminotransferase